VSRVFPPGQMDVSADYSLTIATKTIELAPKHNTLFSPALNSNVLRQADVVG
jgi:hypothetical protein